MSVSSQSNVSEILKQRVLRNCSSGFYEIFRNFTKFFEIFYKILQNFVKSLRILQNSAKFHETWIFKITWNFHTALRSFYNFVWNPMKFRTVPQEFSQNSTDSFTIRLFFFFNWTWPLCETCQRKREPWTNFRLDSFYPIVFSILMLSHKISRPLFHRISLWELIDRSISQVRDGRYESSSRIKG